VVCGSAQSARPLLCPPPWLTTKATEGRRGKAGPRLRRRPACLKLGGGIGGLRWRRPAVAGRRRALPGPERCEPGPTGAFVWVDVQRRHRRWRCGVSLFWAASLFSIITAPRRACAIRAPLRPAASEGEGTGPVEVLPTTLVDWSRLYRVCVLRRTEECHLSDLVQSCVSKDDCAIPAFRDLLVRHEVRTVRRSDICD